MNLTYDTRPNGTQGFTWEVYDRDSGATVASGESGTEEQANSAAELEMLLVGSEDG